MIHNHDLGKAGEELAERYLARRGCEIVDRRVRLKDGCELDLIVRYGAEWVFVEVKTRVDGSMGDSLDAMTPGKIARFRRAVRQCVYLNGLENERIRCDVVGIDFHGEEPAIRHIVAAVTDIG